MQRQTTLVKPNETTKKWYIVDAANKPLGRLASEVAVILMGKDKPSYTPNVDCGDYVIVINASKVSLSGNKLRDKYYYRVSGWTGGLKKRSAGVTSSGKRRGSERAAGSMFCIRRVRPTAGSGAYVCGQT